MNATIFFRVLSEDDKGAALAEAVADVRKCRRGASVTYDVDPTSFSMVPGSPFAYWVSNHIRRLFTKLPPFESRGRRARRGPSSGDDKRRVRAWWEVSPTEIGRRRMWSPFSKGGSYSPYYADTHLLVAWDEARRTFLHFWGRPGRMIERPESLEFFFRPGLTWPRSTVKGLNVRCLCAGAIFADKGPSAFVEGDNREELSTLLGVMSSRVFEFLAYIQHGSRAWEVGTIQRTPVPDLSEPDARHLAEVALRCTATKRIIDTGNENSHAFVVTKLLQVRGESLAVRVSTWQEKLAGAERELVRYQREIDDITFRLYHIEGEDRQGIEYSLGGRREARFGEQGDGDQEVAEAAEEEEEGSADSQEARDLVAELISYAIGCALGRWDVRLAEGRRPAPEPPDQFAPLPICSPGMLADANGLPAREFPPDYPLPLDLDGILVDDEEHRTRDGGTADIVERVGEVLGILFPERGEAIEREACEILGVKSLRDYFRIRFFDEHIKRYSMSRRKAPIYWYLGTRSRAYGVWLYYHRLTRDTLFKVLKDYVEPKVLLEERRLRVLEDQVREAERTGRGVRTAEKQLEDQREFLKELYEFRDNLAEVAHLRAETAEGPKEIGYDPDLNDGVVINIAPLWKLTPWREAEATWNTLRAGNYGWARLAYRLWPGRVREKCKTDRSLAIAHGLESDFFPEGGAESTPRRTRHKAARSA